MATVPPAPAKNIRLDKTRVVAMGIPPFQHAKLRRISDAFPSLVGAAQSIPAYYATVGSARQVTGQIELPCQFGATYEPGLGESTGREALAPQHLAQEQAIAALANATKSELTARAAETRIAMWSMGGRLHVSLIGSISPSAKADGRGARSDGVTVLPGSSSTA
jgi:hypothetical protein